MALPGLFDTTIFSGRRLLTASSFIKAMHPKSEVRPERAALKRILDLGWCGQLKIHGHRAQIHIPSSPDADVLVYNRHGRFHARPLSERLTAEVRRLFQPAEGWTVIDAEWLKPEDYLYVFDVLRREGRLLQDMTYSQRYDYLPRVFSSNCLTVLPLLRTVEKCLEALAADDDKIEGLVLKALDTPGFSDTSIVRCRKV